ncbi:MAG: DUF4350 domain-containing protein [Novosphingobium sp.]|nr:DUF4350 domain-containing protein [Novosphingobium sp.]
MSAPEPIAAGSNPFSARSVLLLVLFGAVVFVALLWMIGSGMATGSANDGGSHAGGKGLNGYAAFAEFAERRGYAVRRSRNEGALDNPGLLVLTPPQWTDGEELESIVSKRRFIGPTLIISPKWVSYPVPAGTEGAKKGWVQLADTMPPTWKGFLDDVGVTIGPLGKGKAAGWSAAGLSGKLPEARAVLWGEGANLVPLVASRPGGRMLAAFIDDGGDYPLLQDMALAPLRSFDRDNGAFPLVVVFEPDLLDNYGMGDVGNARLADALLKAMTERTGRSVTFDLTLNGLGRSANLLTLAFTPPFLAATLCLLLAAIAVGWRAFLRFGPPSKPVRAIAFGKKQLVANAAGLIRRTRRFHLIAAPYLARARLRIVRALGLPREAGPEATDAAIDRALSARNPDATPFSQLAARLSAARRAHDVLNAARDIHTLERTLTR